MTQAQHTPGNWFARAFGKYWEILVSDGRFNSLIAQAHTEKDANLITAAPDLLKAAKALCFDLLKRGVEHGDDATAWDAMQDAIAKAEGN